MHHVLTISLPFCACAEALGGPVGPWRVFLKYAWSPGLACSRAFGDRMAAEVGVIWEPDVSVHHFRPDDDHIVLASDGVWELISSQVAL